jgi:bacterioferritin
MRHLDWLAEAIVDLGGDPDMERSHVDLDGDGPLDWMARDVLAEERAIAQYEQHIHAIDDPKVTRLLGRILSDERAHRDQFAGLSEELAAEGAQPTGPLEERTADQANPGDLAVLQEGVRHEYSVILQYLYHNFVMPQCEVGTELEMQAINEMQHLGWLAEEVAERGGHPVVERGDVVLAGTPAEMLQADIDAERAVTAVYGEQLDQLSEDELRELIERIREHEIYHDAVFSDLLTEVAEQASSAAPGDGSDGDAGGFTVGSLLRMRGE